MNVHPYTLTKTLAQSVYSAPCTASWDDLANAYFREWVHFLRKKKKQKRCVIFCPSQCGPLLRKNFLSRKARYLNDTGDEISRFGKILNIKKNTSVPVKAKMKERTDCLIVFHHSKSTNTDRLVVKLFSLMDNVSG